MHAVALPRMPLVTSCIPIGFAAKAVVSARLMLLPVPVPVPVYHRYHRSRSPVPVLPVLRFCGGAGDGDNNTA